MVSVWKNWPKNWLKTAIFAAVYSVVFGMAAVWRRFGQMAAKTRRKPCQRKLAKPCSATGSRLNGRLGCWRGGRLSGRSVRQPQVASSQRSECPLFSKAVIRRWSSQCPLCAKSGHSPANNLIGKAHALTAGRRWRRSKGVPPQDCLRGRGWA